MRDFTGGASGLDDSYITYDDLSRVTCDAAASGSCPTSGSNVRTSFTSSPAYTASGERQTIVHNHSSYWGVKTWIPTYVTGTDQLSSLWRSGSSADVVFGYTDRGHRSYDDDDIESNDRRDYTYDSRGNLITVQGEVYVSGSWHDYTVTSAYDHKNRRVFKSYLDETANKEAQWFFYYDLHDRLTEVKHTPDIDSPSTYSIFQFFWLGERTVAYYQTDYPGASQTRRFIHADEINRPVEVWSWPASGDTTRVWAINPDLFGWDENLVGSSIYQPLRFPGQYEDEETTSWRSATYPARPALVYNWHRTYDPFTGTYLQVDPKVEDTWEAYNYVSQNPVGMVDPTGMALIDIGSTIADVLKCVGAFNVTADGDGGVYGCSEPLLGQPGLNFGNDDDDDGPKDPGSGGQGQGGSNPFDGTDCGPKDPFCTCDKAWKEWEKCPWICHAITPGIPWEVLFKGKMPDVGGVHRHSSLSDGRAPKLLREPLVIPHDPVMGEGGINDIWHGTNAWGEVSPFNNLVCKPQQMFQCAEAAQTLREQECVQE